MLRDKITVGDKLKFISKPIEQICQIHLNQARYFCSKSDCLQYSYLCDRCKNQNTHNHIDQISQYSAWIEKIVSRIAEVKPPNISNNFNRIFQSQNPQNKKKGEFNKYLEELKRVLSIVENLEMRLNQLIRQSKFKIKGYIRKYQGYDQGKLASKVYLYSNPYILVNKINSERNDDFIKELKLLFRGEAFQPVDSFNSKYEVISLQNKLRQAIKGNSGEVFSIGKEDLKAPTVQIIQQNALVFDNRPETVFQKGEVLIVGFKNLTQLYKLKQKQIDERLAVNLCKCSSLITQGLNNFIGISRDNRNELITYINKKADSFSFEFKIYSILLYCSNNKYYAFIGRDQGKISIFDIATSQIIANLQQAHNSKIEYIQPWQNQMKILSCGRNTAISIYKISNLSNQVRLEYQQQMMIGNGQIQQFQIFSSYLIALLSNRNIYVYDLILKQQYKTAFTEASKSFDMISVLAETQTHLLIATHNQNEGFIYKWVIEKCKPDQIIAEKVVFFQTGDVCVLEICQKEAWLLRLDENDRKLYNFTMLVY